MRNQHFTRKAMSKDQRRKKVKIQGNIVCLINGVPESRARHAIRNDLLGVLKQELKKRREDKIGVNAVESTRTLLCFAIMIGAERRIIDCLVDYKVNFPGEGDQFPISDSIAKNKKILGVLRSAEKRAERQRLKAEKAEQKRREMEEKQKERRKKSPADLRSEESDAKIKESLKRQNRWVD